MGLVREFVTAALTLLIGLVTYKMYKRGEL